MTKKLKVGIAGYGVVGKRRRECVDQNKLLEMVAVYDQIFLEEVSVVGGISSYKNYKKLLEEELDILIVCLTNDIAPEVTIAALNAGLNVFCEKPPGRNVSDIIQVINVEKNNPNLKLMYGFNHRYHHSVQDALKLVHSGELGKIINIRGVYGKAKLITLETDKINKSKEVTSQIIGFNAEQKAADKTKSDEEIANAKAVQDFKDSLRIKDNENKFWREIPPNFWRDILADTLANASGGHFG